MRAVVHDRYGPPDVLRLEDVARPVPRDDEVKVRILATTVNRTDVAFRRGEPLNRLVGGLTRPRWRVLGSELAGEVEAVGSAVREFRAGDRVFGNTAFLRQGFGAHAELRCMHQDAALLHMPPGMTLEEAAAACDGALSALANLRLASLGPGRRILIYGASGAIGTAAVQLAKGFGAHVTAVCSTPNLDLVASLGADEVIDYTREDFTERRNAYDVIFDAVGKHAFLRCRRALRRGGLYMATDGPMNLPLALVTSRSNVRRVRMGIPRHTKDEVRFVLDRYQAGTYRPVVDRVYRMDEVVAATRYVETEHKRGNVVLTVV